MIFFYFAHFLLSTITSVWEGGLKALFWDAFLGAGEENLREKLVICLVWLGLAVVFWVL